MEKKADLLWPSREANVVVKPVPGLDDDSASTTSSSSPTPKDDTESSRILVVGGRGNYLRLENGREILDACGGAAVAVSMLPNSRDTLFSLENLENRSLFKQSCRFLEY